MYICNYVCMYVQMYRCKFVFRFIGANVSSILCVNFSGTKSAWRYVCAHRTDMNAEAQASYTSPWQEHLLKNVTDTPWDSAKSVGFLLVRLGEDLHCGQTSALLPRSDQLLWCWCTRIPLELFLILIIIISSIHPCCPGVRISLTSSWSLPWYLRNFRRYPVLWAVHGIIAWTISRWRPWALESLP